MNACLLLINPQADHFLGGKSPLPNAETSIKRAGEALQCFRDHGRPLFHVQTVNRTNPKKPFFTGTAGILFHDLTPHFEREPIAYRFLDGDLPIMEIHAFAQKNNVDRVFASFYGAETEWQRYVEGLNTLGTPVTLITDASAFLTPSNTSPVFTIEDLFNQLVSMDPRAKTQVSQTVLYNANHNVLPKDK